MTVQAKTLLRLSVRTAALTAALAAGCGLAASAQPTGIGQLAQSTPNARALDVLRGMQRDSVKVDSRHWQAAQRCDRAAMAEYLRQLNELAAQARNVLHKAFLPNQQDLAGDEAVRIVENIEMRARHAASRQAQNCGEPATQEPTGMTGATGATGAARSQSSAEQLLELQKESVRLNSLHYEAAQRCDRAEMERLQALLDALVDQAGEIMRRAAMGPRGAASAVFRDAENRAHNIARRADEARKRQPKNCPEETGQQQNGGAGASNTTGSTQREVAPPPPPPAPAPAPTPRFNSGSPLDGIRNRAWSAMEEMTDAYEKCDSERFESALGELEQLARDAKAAAAAATGSAEFSTISPEEARNLADELRHQAMQRRYLLDGLKRECSKGHRPGGVGTLLGPRRPDATDAGPVENEGQEQQPQSMPNLLPPMKVLGGGEQSQAEESGQPMDAPEPSTDNARQAIEPAGETRSRPVRKRLGERCDKPEGERPADCPKR